MNSAPAGWTLCVDFGTAYSKAAAAPRDAWTRFLPGEVRPLTLASFADAHNPFLLDSAVFVDDDAILFGAAALSRAGKSPAGKRAALRSFKTLLSVSDLERALNTAAPAMIDPHRMFPMRDLIVLYLAYLSAAIERAVRADDLLAGARTIERRYAAPAWRGGDSAGLHGTVLRLFAEAEALRMALGEELLEDGGIPLNSAPALLAAARARPVMREMGLVYEATAAAAYTCVGLEDSASHLIVVDIGAGTTDIAAMSRTRSRVEELPDARVTLKQAGDLIDRVIANIVLEANQWARSPAHQAALWAALMNNMRDIKESVFHDGRALLRFEGRTLTVTLRELQRNADFRQFVRTLSDAYRHGLEVLRDAAKAVGGTEIQAVAVGGGASAPFIQELIRTKPSGAGRINLVARPATPDWAHAREFRGNLAPVFPQLAIAIGGALSPDSMLAAPGGFNPAANDRTGSPGVRG